MSGQLRINIDKLFIETHCTQIADKPTHRIFLQYLPSVQNKSWSPNLALARIESCIVLLDHLVTLRESQASIR